MLSNPMFDSLALAAVRRRLPQEELGLYRVGGWGGVWAVWWGGGEKSVYNLLLIFGRSWATLGSFHKLLLHCETDVSVASSTLL